MSKTKTNIKIKLSKRAPSCFPEVQIVLQVSQREKKGLRQQSMSVGGIEVGEQAGR